MTNNPTIDGVSRVLIASDREKRMYIAGPMTGIEDYNFPAFNSMADKMRAAGWHVENPADHGIVTDAEWGDYLRYDIGCLASCEAIMLLPGWTASRGARLEVSIAKELGVEFMYADGAEHAPAVERQEPVAIMGNSTEGAACVWFSRPADGTLLFAGAPELAALQSRIDQLEAQAMYAAATYQAARARIEELESGRGEPVAWMRTDIPGMCIADEVRAHNLKIGGAPAKGVEAYNVPLYASPPEPVVTDERAEFEKWLRNQPHVVNLGFNRATSKYVLQEDEDSWQAWQARSCLDATAALNRRDTPTFELADADGYEP